MALSFIGKSISLISHSDVRYRGILAGIDPAASTIQLSNVYSMGTESRRPPAEFIPPVQEPYQYIIFRASEVKDLAVDEPVPMRSVHDDPAVLGASALVENPTYTYPPPVNLAAPPPNAQQQQQQQPLASPAQPQTYAAASAPHPAPPPAQAPTQAQAQAQAQDHAAPPAPPSVRPPAQGRRTNSIHTAAASLETVERAIGDLRVSTANITAAHAATNHHQPRGGRRGGRSGGAPPVQTPQIKVPATDFDFESSNAKFDKAAMTPRSASAAGKEEDAAGEGTEESEKGKDKEKEKEKEKEVLVAYNPQKSFFDSLSSSTAAPPPNGGANGGGGGGGGRGARRGGGRGGGGIARNRREEERERNVATFGEPGGVGLMGPGAYVGGWGGYGRRGGRPRRGGGVGGPVHQQVPTRV